MRLALLLTRRGRIRGRARRCWLAETRRCSELLRLAGRLCRRTGVVHAFGPSTQRSPSRRPMRPANGQRANKFIPSIDAFSLATARSRRPTTARTGIGVIFRKATGPNSRHSIAHPELPPAATRRSRTLPTQGTSNYPIPEAIQTPDTSYLLLPFIIYLRLKSTSLPPFRQIQISNKSQAQPLPVRMAADAFD